VKKAIVFLATIAAIGCGHENPNIKVEKYDDGAIKFIKHYKDGKLNGQAKWFYPNGTTEQITQFVNGKEEGNSYYFYPSGSLKNFRNWKNGNMNGYANDFFDSSVWVMKAVLFFNDSGLIAFKRNYDGSGNMVSEIRGGVTYPKQ
jgi:antitoxin component YwqK of YwqJK toxin-antitoxin module